MRLLRVLLLSVLCGTAGAEESYGPYRISAYQAVDGDTIRVSVHLWIGLTQQVDVRLSGVNTPELHPAFRCEQAGGCEDLRECEKAAALRAKAYVDERLQHAGAVMLTNVTPDKYAGRAEGRLLLDGVDLAEDLIQQGLGRPYHGETRGWWCNG